jgi:hypothetical protein
MRVIVSCVCVALLLSGCAAALVGGAFYKSSKTRQAKEQFIAQFNQTNIEREKAGLLPLDLCTEKYHFDKKWADNDPVCEERIIRYEMGDTTALGNPTLEVEIEEVEVEPAPVAQPVPQSQPQTKPETEPVSPQQTGSE